MPRSLKYRGNLFDWYFHFRQWHLPKVANALADNMREYNFDAVRKLFTEEHFEHLGKTSAYTVS